MKRKSTKYFVARYSLSTIFGVMLLGVLENFLTLLDWRFWVIFLAVTVAWTFYVVWRDEYIIRYHVRNALELILKDKNK